MNDAHNYYRPLKDVATEYTTWATNSRRIGLGFPFFDSRTLGGAAAGELVLFLARSQVGKTTLGLNIINNNPDTPTVIFSLEMHGRYLIPRLSAMHTNTPTREIETTLRDGLSHPAVEQTVTDFPHLAIVDAGEMSPRRMSDALAEVEDALGEKVELVIVDYLELLKGTPSLSDVSSVEKIAWGMKDWAKKHDLVNLVFHQVSRSEGEGGDKQLSIKSGKYGGEQSADYLLAAYRPALRIPPPTQDEYMRLRWQLPLQFLKTRGGSEIHPAGCMHYLHPDTMKVAASMREWFNEDQLRSAGWAA